MFKSHKAKTHVEADADAPSSSKDDLIQEEKTVLPPKGDFKGNDPMNYNRDWYSVNDGHDARRGGSKTHPSGGVTPQRGGFLSNQRAVMWEFIKRIGKNVLESKDIRDVSLPVRIFEPRSFLQRATDHMSTLPFFMYKACETKDPLERLKWVTAFGLRLHGVEESSVSNGYIFLVRKCGTEKISGMQYTVNVQKPFNPILGETYQAKLSDGTQVFAEQTSHHPPVTHWIVDGPKGSYQYTGAAEWKGSIRGNAIKGTSHGEKAITFADGTKIILDFAPMWVCGLMWGDRVVEYLDFITVTDVTNKMQCKLQLNPDGKGMISSLLSFGKSAPPTDYFRGDIVKMTDEDSEEEPEVLAKCEGSWLGKVIFDGKTYWDLVVDSTVSDFCQPVANPLPSDVRFREDLNALADNDTERAEELKVYLEERQRYDRKLRKKGRAERHQNGLCAAHEHICE